MLRNLKVLIIYATLFVSPIALAQSQILPDLDKKELSEARALAEIYRDIKRADRRDVSVFEKINHRDFSKTFRYLKRSEVFSAYYLELKELEKVGKIKTWDHFSHCFKLNKQIFETPLEATIKKECNLKLLQLAKKNPLNNTQFKEYFVKNLNFFLREGENQFSDFLKTIEKNITYSKLVSDLVANYIAITKTPIPKPIVKNILITPFLTQQVQEVGIDTPETRKLFREEIIHQLAQVTEVDRNREKLIQDSFDFYEKNKSLISNDYLRRRLVILSKRLIRQGDFENASLVTNKIFQISDEENFSDDVFLYIWPDIIQEKYNQASKKLVESNILNQADKLSSKSLFWVAYTLQQKEKNKVAKYFYEEIIRKNPINYYAIMSMKQIKSMGNDNDSIGSTPIVNPLYKWEKIPLTELSDEAYQAVKRVLAFSRVDEYTLLNFEQAKLRDFKVDNILKNETIFPTHVGTKVKESLSMLIAEILKEDKNYLKSFKIVYSEMRKDDLIPSTKLLELLFPQPFLPKIKKIIKTDVDPLIVLSLIRQESAFNPRARSHVGARGLMQLMPSTARGLNRRISSTHLNDPDTNLKIGIKYFDMLYKKYDRNLVYTLAAYNAGENRVKAWKKTYFAHNDKFLHQVELIPFQETNLYVKLIVRNLFFYKLLNGHKDDSPKNERIFDVALVSI